MPAETPRPAVDAAAAHRHFSAHCFNEAWTYIDKAERTPEDEEAMLRLALASHWHWTQREDFAPVNASIAYWQISRVFALMGQADNARRFGRRCLEAVGDDLPFYRGFGYEALARAAAVAGDLGEAARLVALAREQAERVADEEERRMLLSDLETIPSP